MTKLREEPMLPGLFGLKHTSRDFTQKGSWGKNQFNNSFPASLACFMASQGLEPVYLTLNDSLQVEHGTIPVHDLFGLDPLSSDLYFSFESQFSPYAPLVIGTLPRVDLVTMNRSQPLSSSLRALEVKLTALPDNSTCLLKEEEYGSEIVVRPDTIVYLALSIATTYYEDRVSLKEHLFSICKTVDDWDDPSEMLPLHTGMVEALNTILLAKLPQQSPLLLQPIWKTEGKSGVLSSHCLDLFVWSDFAFTRLFADHRNGRSITRSARTLIWLIKMLYDFAQSGQFDHRSTIDRMTFNTKNDKAFALSGGATRPYMSSPELQRPRVPKTAIKEIILGGGQYFLSPERRFDAAIASTPGLFSYHHPEMVAQYIKETPSMDEGYVYTEEQ